MGGNEDLFILESEETGTVDALLQKTPWWTISIAFHCLIMLVLWVAKFGVIPVKGEDVVIEVRPIPEMKEEEYIRDRKKDLVTYDPLVVKPEKVKAPVVDVDVPKDDHTETPNDEPFELAKGTLEGLTLDNEVPMATISGPIGPGKTPRPLGPRGPYGDRLGGKEAKTAGEGGGPETIRTVDAGLRWLARHQSDDGAWHPDTWSRECPAGDSCVGKGGGGQHAVGGDYPGAVTGFALLAFLGDGHTDRVGKFRVTVRKALEYLKRTQLENGKFEAGQGRRMYSHGIAALAVAEAYGMTKSAKWKGMAQDAIDYICYVQNPLGGWNYSSPAAR
ncbi:prenyltransferase/squalene oxidase repeat-containing protein, partial [Planctomycetota bacterium]